MNSPSHAPTSSGCHGAAGSPSESADTSPTGCSRWWQASSPTRGRTADHPGGDRWVGGVSNRRHCRLGRGARGVLGRPISRCAPRSVARQRCRRVRGCMDHCARWRRGRVRRPDGMARSVPPLHRISRCRLRRAGSAGEAKEIPGAQLRRTWYRQPLPGPHQRRRGPARRCPSHAAREHLSRAAAAGAWVGALSYRHRCLVRRLGGVRGRALRGLGPDSGCGAPAGVMPADRAPLPNSCSPDPRETPDGRTSRSVAA